MSEQELHERLIEVGVYLDDTKMGLSLAASLLRRATAPLNINEEECVDWLAEREFWFKRFVDGLDVGPGLKED